MRESIASVTRIFPIQLDLGPVFSLAIGRGAPLSGLPAQASVRQCRLLLQLMNQFTGY